MMQGAELSEYIKRAESADDPRGTVLELLKDIAAGKVKRAEVHAHYRAEYAPRLTRLFGLFGAGTLFKAQRMDFGSWLDGKEYANDFQAYLEFKSTLDMVNMGRREPERLPSGMDLFICKMVLPSPRERKAKAEYMGLDRCRAGWTGLQQREGWMTWRG